MPREIQSNALRYGLALGAFVVLLFLTFAIPRISPINFDVTTLIILGMIATAWYLGRGPGLMFAVLFELTLVYLSAQPYTSKSAVITFNRLVLFGSVVLFASSRRMAERHLREQREVLQVTLASIGDAVIATDINGLINFINPTAESLTGWTMREAAGQPLELIFKIVNEETRESVESPFSAVKREGAVVGLANHTVLMTKDGREIPIEDSGAPIKDAKGKIIGIIIVFHDVTERRSVELERQQLLESEQLARAEAEAANRLKDEFLATVSHELRTPLNAILGWSAMLNRGGKNLADKTSRNALEVIERNAKAQAGIISDILDVSRIVTGKLHIERQPVELAPLIQSAVETILPAAEAKNITLKVELDTNPILIAADPERLQQVIWNLVSNAVKFTLEGGQIEVSAEQRDDFAEIRVTDNGIGINREFLPDVFERFRQADSTTTRMHSGLGLGLAIVRHLVELHGGTIRAESEGEGRGAAFTMRLPLIEAHKFSSLPAAGANLVKEPGGSLKDEPNLSGLRVLVVDDEPDTLEVLSVMLNLYGAQVRTAASSAEALKTFLEWQPTVLVSDIGMPNEDGFTLIGKVRALTPEQGGKVPAAALTAYVREEDRLQALAAGFQKHIAKPVEPVTLAETIAELANQAKRN